MNNNSTFKYSQVDALKIIKLYEDNPEADIVLKFKKAGNQYALVTGDASDCTVFSDIHEEIEFIKKISPALFGNANDIIEDRDLFLTYLARLIYYSPILVREFEAIYQQNPSEYYGIAVSNKYYGYCRLNELSLMGDIAVKRTFGVLLSAEDDSQLREAVENVFYSFDTSLKQMIDKQSLDLVKHKDCARCWRSSMLSVFVFAYLLLNHYDGTPSPITNFFADKANKNYEELDARRDASSVISYVEGDNNPSKYIEFSSDYVWKIIRETRSILDISTISETFMHEWDDKNGEPYNTKLSNMLLHCPKDDPCHEEIERARNLVLGFDIDTLLLDFCTPQFFPSKPISKAEQQELLRVYAYTFKEVDDNNVDIGKAKVKLSYDTYVALLLLHFFAQDEIEVKQYFFEHNNETMFSHVAVLNERIERLQQEKNDMLGQIDQVNEENASLRHEIETFTAVNKKEAKDISLPYLEEISMLRKKNAVLEARLGEEAKKQEELLSLREFAFSMQSKYVPDDTAANLEEILNGQKIVIIGGHINWRINLKRKYPSFIVMDGHLETADFSILNNVDFVFLNVSNMSHSVYYNVMNILRNSSTPFDYLGRTINQELYEKEMVDIMMKHEARKAKHE